MNLLGIESSSKKLSVGLMKGKKFTELHSEKINDTCLLYTSPSPRD